MNIIAIGGGSMEEGHTEQMDRELVRLSGKQRPRALFIPTASSDDEGYIQIFTKIYTQLGCDTDVLRLLSGDDPQKIRDADLIYVGGGNTKMMLEVWRRQGVDNLLKEHLDKGRPAGGVSAGAICWFRVGNSDWPQYEGIPSINTARLDCLGFVDLTACPHTRAEVFRLGEFAEMMRSEKGAGVGLDNGCAIQIKSDEYRILSSMPGAMAHRIEWVDGNLEQRILPPHDDFRKLSGF